ncbi:MAG: helix-hairpin-helix domain-containing protein [Gemmatimonadota bacterium]
MKTDLQRVPGVGPSIERCLLELGLERAEDLRSQQPDALYDRLCELRGERIDPCVKYVFRCAVYWSTTPEPDPELLKWWNWKDAH